MYFAESKSLTLLKFYANETKQREPKGRMSGGKVNSVCEKLLGE